MIRVSILYPRRADFRFDLDDYLKRHMPMAIDRLGPTLKGVSVEIGVGGGQPGQPAPFVALCHFLFDSQEAFHAAFDPHAEVLFASIRRYTDIEPVFQFSEIRILR